MTQIKEYNICQKAKGRRKMDTILNQQQQQPGILGGKGKVREGGRNVMKEKIMEVERK